MYDEEERLYLKNYFGTDKIGDCKHCNLAGDEKLYRMFPCKQKVCVMLAKLDMFKNERKYRSQADSNPRIAGMMKKLAKMNLLGFKEEIIGPWLIMRSDGGEGAGWFNTKTQAYGSKIYKDILIFGSIIICVTDYNITKTGKTCKIEIFSMHCGDVNIGLGIPNLVFKVTKDSLLMSRSNCGYVVCDAKDENTNVKVKVLINYLGNRVAILKDNKMHIQDSLSGILVELPTFKQVIRFDDKLNVMNKSSDAIVIPLPLY